MVDINQFKKHASNLVNVERCQILDYFENLINNLIDEVSIYNVEMIEPDGKFIKKEQILNLKNKLALTLTGDTFYYVIKDAEKMNASAYNSLLKFLEEPPQGVCAILVTTDVHSIPETIRSRCVLENVTSTAKDPVPDYDFLIRLIEEKSYIMFKKELNTIYKETNNLKFLEDILYFMLEKNQNKVEIIQIINELKYNTNYDLLVDKIYSILTK